MALGAWGSTNGAIGSGRRGTNWGWAVAIMFSDNGDTFNVGCGATWCTELCASVDAESASESEGKRFLEFDWVISGY